MEWKRSKAIASPSLAAISRPTCSHVPDDVNNLGKCFKKPRITGVSEGFQRSYKTSVPELFAWNLESYSQALTQFVRLVDPQLSNY
jgi:hypothetical protein